MTHPTRPYKLVTGTNSRRRLGIVWGIEVRKGGKVLLIILGHRHKTALTSAQKLHKQGYTTKIVRG